MRKIFKKNIVTCQEGGPGGEGRGTAVRAKDCCFLAGVAQRLFAASKDSKYGGKFKIQSFLWPSLMNKGQ